MKTFATEYRRNLKVLPQNPFLWLLVFLVLTGGHSWFGKIIAIVALFLIVPAFQIWHDRLEKKLDEKYPKT